MVQTHGIKANSLGEQLGFRTGDKIVSLHGGPYRRFKELIEPEVFLKEGGYYEVLRDSTHKKILIPRDFVENFAEREAMANFILPREPFRVAEVVPGSAAAAAGLQAGDSIVSFAGQPVHYFDELRTLTQQYANQPVEVQVIRMTDGRPQALTFNCVLKNDTLGIFRELRLPYTEEHYSLPKSLVLGTGRAFSLIWINVLGISKIVRGHVSPSKSLAGPVGIAKMFGGRWRWDRFWYLVGLISVFVAIFNLLPIPALDGGHVVFCLYEMVVGRSLPVKVLSYAQTVAWCCLLGLWFLC